MNVTIEAGDLHGIPMDAFLKEKEFHIKMIKVRD